MLQNRNFAIKQMKNFTLHIDSEPQHTTKLTKDWLDSYEEITQSDSTPMRGYEECNIVRQGATVKVKKIKNENVKILKMLPLNRHFVIF